MQENRIRIWSITDPHLPEMTPTLENLTWCLDHFNGVLFFEVMDGWTVLMRSWDVDDVVKAVEKHPDAWVNVHFKAHQAKIASDAEIEALKQAYWYWRNNANYQYVGKLVMMDRRATFYAKKLAALGVPHFCEA